MQLVAFFHAVEKSGGLSARMKLAMHTGISATEAESVPDSSELVARFQAAVSDVLRLGATTPSSTPVPEESNTTSVNHLRRQIRTFEDLLSQRALYLGTKEATAKRITEAAAAGIGVARASVWLLEGGGDSIRCLDVFELTGTRHSSGLSLRAADFPAYFEALRSEHTIAAVDAHTDPRTSCFSLSYLRPLGIGAMLDVPIWLEGRMVGVVCHEHLGGTRQWTRDDESFANLMSNLMALSLERRG
jgi:hypothetical protein